MDNPPNPPKRAAWLGPSDDAARVLLHELRSYVDLSDADEAILRRLAPHAEPHLPAIADEFYAVIRMHEGAFTVLKDEAQAQRLHASLQVWLRELLEGPYDLKYLLRHTRVGETHARVGLNLRFMVAAMTRIRCALEKIAAEAFTDDPAERERARLAVGKACDLDLAIMMESYRDDFVTRARRAQAREREALLAQLDARRRLFVDAMEAADVLMLAFDSSGKVLLTNRKMEEVTGFSAEDLGDEDTLARLFGQTGAQVRARWSAAAQGSVPEVEGDVTTRSGKVRIVRWHASQHSRDSEAPALVVVGLDVTREREAERRARQNERLAAAGALAAGLAHEVRNPLNGANLHVAVLDRALARIPNVPASAREATAVLRGEIKRLSDLVTDFLDVARPKPLSRSELDLNEIARAVTVLLKPEAEAHRAHLTVEAFPFPAVAPIDGERIKQVLVNLIRNGLEAVAEDGHVTVRIRRHPRDVEIDVTDDGPGIPDTQTPIFDAFFTTKEKGTGLGLSIVHRIVSDHGGDISFVSRPGATTFTLRLPAEVTSP